MAIIPWTVWVYLRPQCSTRVGDGTILLYNVQWITHAHTHTHTQYWTERCVSSPFLPIMFQWHTPVPVETLSGGKSQTTPCHWRSKCKEVPSNHTASIVCVCVCVCLCVKCACFGVFYDMWSARKGADLSTYSVIKMLIDALRIDSPSFECVGTLACMQTHTHVHWNTL